MRFLEILNRPATVLVVLGLLTIVNGFLFYHRYQEEGAPNTDEASSGNEETTSPAGSSTEIGGAAYVEPTVPKRWTSMFPRSTKVNTSCSAAPLGTSMLLQR